VAPLIGFRSEEQCLYAIAAPQPRPKLSSQRFVPETY
jgi:hypothetical protein